MASSGPEPLVNAVLLRNRTASAVLLVVLVLLAWAWLISGAGTGMAASGSLRPQVTERPPMAGMTMAPASVAWSSGRAIVTFAMWWIMMVAMMLPSAAPMILLFARAAGHGGTGLPRPPAEAFLAGYLICWGLFSLLATALHWQFERLYLIDPGAMASTSRWLTAAVLLLAGMYQLTPLKYACLRQCRDPARFLSRH